MGHTRFPIRADGDNSQTGCAGAQKPFSSLLEEFTFIFLRVQNTHKGRYLELPE
jgi:hypothetical protein